MASLSKGLWPLSQHSACKANIAVTGGELGRPADFKAPETSYTNKLLFGQVHPVLVSF